MSRRKKKPTVHEALRESGLVMLPRLWILPEDMEKIHEIASRATFQVNEIRAQVRRQKMQPGDPTVSKEAAWELFEQMKANS